ncbi:SIS domain-containing protein [Ruminococcaceae bacterium OttesenSCG-928-D13]|nr:SIS domain-containing protein [Ruminococcaceae bacterium OttesenSCG-928-D13]
MASASEALLDRMVTETPALAECRAGLQMVFEIIRTSFAQGGKLLLCGNGGSAADCEHIVGELMKGFLLPRPVPQAFRDHPALQGEGDRLQGALPAISLTGQPALCTAFSNDVDPEMGFAQQVYGYGRAGDVLLGLSTSGNASNVCHAVRVAQAMGLKTIGMTGQTGGKLKELCDFCLCAPATETYRVQEYHLPLYHTLCAMLEYAFFAV